MIIKDSITKKEREEEISDWRRWKAGDSTALEPLMNRFQPTMEVWYRKISKSQLPEQVLRGEIEHQVLEAFKVYDPTKGTKLNTWINSRLPKVFRLIYENSNIGRIPEQRQRMVGTYLNAKDALIKRMGREPNTEELMDELRGWNLKDITNLEKEVRKDLIFTEDFQALSFEGQPLEYEALNWVYYTLTGKEKLVFEYMTGYGGKAKKKQREIAEELGVSEATITNIKTRIAEKIDEASRIIGR